MPVEGCSLAALRQAYQLQQVSGLLQTRDYACAVAAADPRTTLNRYLELLSAIFPIKQIPAWSAGQAQRAIGTPKLAFTGTGIDPRGCRTMPTEPDARGRPARSCASTGPGQACPRRTWPPGPPSRTT